MMRRFLTPAACEECGEVPVFHFAERLPQKIEETFINPSGIGILTTWMEGVLDRAFRSIFTPDVIFAIAKGAEALGMVHLPTSAKPRENTRTLALYEGAAAAGVTLYAIEIGLLQLGFIAEKNVRGRMNRVGFHVIPRPRGFVSQSLSWLDDKWILKQKLKAAGIPTADGAVVGTENEAVALFQKLGRPVIAKPHRGSRGRHTTLDMRTEADVRRGFRIAAELSSRVMIETYLHGTVHRVTLVGGKPIAIARREYPHVVGDGVHTVEELIDIENRNPLRDGTHFRKLDKKYRVGESLKKQDLSLDSVAERGRKVIISDKNSRLHGTVTEDITDSVHTENITLFLRLGEVLGDPIVGVDFMIEDMTRPWAEQPDSGVLECNSMPFIDVHHKVVSGRTINVAKYLWEEIFREEMMR